MIASISAAWSTIAPRDVLTSSARRAHQGQPPGVEELAGAGGEGDAQLDDVGGGEQVVELEAGEVVVSGRRAPVDDFQVERPPERGDPATDRPEADDAEALAA